MTRNSMPSCMIHTLSRLQIARVGCSPSFKSSSEGMQTSVSTLGKSRRGSRVAPCLGHAPPLSKWPVMQAVMQLCGEVPDCPPKSRRQATTILWTSDRRSNHMRHCWNASSSLQTCNVRGHCSTECGVASLHLDVIKLPPRSPCPLAGGRLRSARRARQAAYWASWADALPLSHQGHAWSTGCHIPSWVDIRRRSTIVDISSCSPHRVDRSHGVGTAHLDRCAQRPPPEEKDSAPWRTGRQREAASRVERSCRELELFPSKSDSDRAMLCSQSRPLSGAALAPTLPSALRSTCSGSCFCAVFACLPLPLHVFDDVAANMTLLATIEQHAQGEGLLAIAGFLWSGPLHKRTRCDQRHGDRP